MATAAAAQAASGSTAGAPHVLVVPYPTHGHMRPLLAARGLRLTVVATPATAHILAPLLAAHPSSVRPLSFPSAAGHDTSGPTSVAFDFHAHAAALRAPLREWLRSRAARSDDDSGDGEPGRVVAVLSDFFCGWTQPLAAEAGVPQLVFAPSGALATAATHSLFRRNPRPPEGDAGHGYAVSFPALPGAPAFPWRQISQMYRNYAEGAGGAHAEAIKDNFLWNLESAAFVCNTCHPLEGKYLDAQPLEDLAGKRVWLVGPVAPPPESDSDSTAAADGASDVTAWLDAFPDSSVAYVSFGTMIVPPPPHAAALASALERSGTPFVWAAAPRGGLLRDALRVELELGAGGLRGGGADAGVAHGRRPVLQRAAGGGGGARGGGRELGRVRRRPGRGGPRARVGRGRRGGLRRREGARQGARADGGGGGRRRRQHPAGAGWAGAGAMGAWKRETRQGTMIVIDQA